MTGDREFGYPEAGMHRIQEAIIRGVQARGIDLKPSHFRWNRGHPFTEVPDLVAMRIDFAAYRCFEEILTREQIERGLGDPTVAAYVAAAISQIAGGDRP